MKKKNKPKPVKCNAISKQTGKRCERYATPGKKKCRFHGGTNDGAPKENKNALKHGLYARGPLRAEKNIWPDIAVGDIDEEIKIAKLQLKRACELQREYLEARETDGADTEVGFELAEVEREDGVFGGYSESGKPMSGARTKKTRKRPDYEARIRALLKLIADLERMRKEIVPFNRDYRASQETAKILRKLRKGKINVTEAALSFNELGLGLPESVKIMLQNTPQVHEEEEPEEYGASIEEIEREYEAKMAEAVRQEAEFVPQRESEVEEAKSGLADFEMFSEDFDPNNPMGSQLEGDESAEDVE